MKSARFVPELKPVAADEVILWRGRPLAFGLFWRAFPTRILFAYFTLLAIWTLAAGMHFSSDFSTVCSGLRWILCGAFVVIILISGAALLLAVSTRYIVTNIRVVLQFGVAFPIALTLPLSKITSVDLRLYSDGSGDIPLSLSKEKLAYLLLWPHARPWRFASPQPMLRTVPDASNVALILKKALLAAHQVNLLEERALIGSF